MSTETLAVHESNMAHSHFFQHLCLKKRKKMFEYECFQNRSVLLYFATDLICYFTSDSFMIYISFFVSKFYLNSS